ncbi:hypothetical protein BZA70DRAFT_288122 [Myxozyma melibiosi]|uniref:NECAP PHear domain-containing protein n=1 Tax=Myxozyma melibiosi TaxID=54550 RepID=A0ABR1FBY4_9ASCO
MSYESIIFIAREVMVYQIPPLKTSKGYRASEWDVAKPLWTGRLKVVEKSVPVRAEAYDSSELRCELMLEDGNTGELFATAVYGANGKGVEQVVDSSRFFVIRVVDGERHAYLGMGFQERSESFDFNIALQDYKRHATPGTGLTEATNAKEPTKDYSLKAGETITVEIGNKTRRRKAGSSSGSSNSSGALPFLPPPPSAAQVKQQQSEQEEQDDFGEFVS